MDKAVNSRWMIYGAYGYTGELIAREAVRRGHRPVIAGRSEAKLAPLAEELGIEHRAFDLAGAETGLSDIAVVLNCAGPFSSTAAALVDACLKTKTHYVDITGEIPVFQMCHEFDTEAKDAGILLCPGAGFDIVPTDCLAAMLEDRMPEAQTINLAFSFGTRPSIGTARTIVEGMTSGGLIRRDRQLVAVANGYRVRRIAFPGGPLWAVTIPWGDVFTSGVSTGAANGMVYMALPRALGILMRLTNPLRGLLGTGWAQRRLNDLVDRLFSGGPDAEARANQRTAFWGEAIDAAGRRTTMRMSAPNAYELTADAALEIALYCLSATGRSGYVTPSMLLGPEFIGSRPGVRIDANA